MYSICLLQTVQATTFVMLRICVFITRTALYFRKGVILLNFVYYAFIVYCNIIIPFLYSIASHQSMLPYKRNELLNYNNVICITCVSKRT